MELHSLQQTAEAPISHETDRQFNNRVIAGVKHINIARTLTHESPDTFSKMRNIINREVSMLSGNPSINRIDGSNSNINPQPGCVICNDKMHALETCPYFYRAKKDLKEGTTGRQIGSNGGLPAIPSTTSPTWQIVS